MCRKQTLCQRLKIRFQLRIMTGSEFERKPRLGGLAAGIFYPIIHDTERLFTQPTWAARPPPGRRCDIRRLLIRDVLLLYCGGRCWQPAPFEVPRKLRVLSAPEARNKVPL